MYSLGRKCIPGSLIFCNVRFVQLFVAFPGEGVSNNNGMFCATSTLDILLLLSYYSLLGVNVMCIMLYEHRQDCAYGY